MWNLIKSAIKGKFEKIKNNDFVTTLRRPLFRIRKLFYVLILNIKLKTLNQNYSLESLIDFVFHYGEGLLSPLQIKSENLSLLHILKNHKPKYILEIGTAKGGTLFLTTRIASEDAVIISIDLPGGEYFGGYEEWKIPLFKSFSLPKQEIHLIRADSHEVATLNKVRFILKGNKIDYMFIDGDHTYNGVKSDFTMYSPLVKSQAIIAFHDIVDHPPELKVGVNKFWNEIKEKYEYKEIVEDWYQKFGGIGILKNIG